MKVTFSWPGQSCNYCNCCFSAVAITCQWDLKRTTLWLSAFLFTDICDFVIECTDPVKILSSQLTQWELTLKLKESSFWGHLVVSQWTHKMSSQCDLNCSELSLSLQLTSWACNSHCELAVSYSWKHPGELTVQWYQWAHCELVSCELTVSWSHVSSPF